MIVIFVIDTSPSMRHLAQDGSSERLSGMTRLDLAKMAVESLTKGLRKRVLEHNMQFQQEAAVLQTSLHNLGLGHCPHDQFLLLATGRQKSQYQTTAACGAGGRLLVGYGDSIDFHGDGGHDTIIQHGSHGGFDRCLKQLRVTDENKPGQKQTFSDDEGGAAGLNIAMSAGMQLMSRYRLSNRATENFGMGRLLSSTMLAPSGGGQAMNALMPACLILLTDGECLRKPASEGGGSLQLQFGSSPLRDFYLEPFRWDQRVFCLGIGAQDGVTSSQYIPEDLRRLCSVTGGGQALLRSTTGLSQVVDSLLKMIAPPRPKDMPISYPLRTSTTPTAPQCSHSSASSGLFVNGGPICCFQGLEAGMNGEQSPTQRAMLLYVPYEQPQVYHGAGPSQAPPYSPPTWCIPESFFPSKTSDSLPPRLAQPLLRFSENYSMIGSDTFDPGFVMKLLQRLDQLTWANRKLSSSTSQRQCLTKVLQRDVYVCEWLSEDGKSTSPPRGSGGMEYFPVCVQGAGRPLSEGGEHFLNIGILHVPNVVTPLTRQSPGAKFSTLTLLPPEPQILLPLLVKAAEAEQRMLKRHAEANDVTGKAGATFGSSGPKSVHLDEHWRSDFRAYMFRIPPYYHNALKRSLRPILPPSAHSLLNLEGIETLASQCLSKICLQKIRNGEQVARETNERLERQEAELRSRGAQAAENAIRNAANARHPNAEVIGYGQYDPRDSTTSYLAALRTMPAPWRVKDGHRANEKDVSVVDSSSQDGVSETMSITSVKETAVKTVVDILGDLPPECLLPYYESRRRWIFGGSGLTTRGLHVEGVSNDGSNVQHVGAHHGIEHESLLAFAGVGASTVNRTTTAKMSDFRERLLWSRAPIVGYGSNDSHGVSATTAPDGSPRWSVDDDALPASFFDPRTGEFIDSVQTRASSRIVVSFGNPYKQTRRGDAIVPEKFLNQSPSFKLKGDDLDAGDGPHTPPGSPPHDSFSSTEGEDEAVFPEKPLKRPSPHHHDDLSNDVDKSLTVSAKRPQEDTESRVSSKKSKAMSETPRPPPPSKPAQKKPPPPPPLRAPPRPPVEKRPVPSQVKPPTRGPQPPAPKSSPKPMAKEASPSTEGTEKTVEQIEKAGPGVQSPDAKPNVDLPPGWMCVWSKSQKRWYFFDTKTNKSVWQWPPPGGLPK